MIHSPSSSEHLTPGEVTELSGVYPALSAASQLLGVYWGTIYEIQLKLLAVATGETLLSNNCTFLYKLPRWIWLIWSDESH